MDDTTTHKAIFPPRITTTKTIIIMNFSGSNFGSNFGSDEEEESVGGSAISSVDASTMDSSLTCRGTKKRKSTMLMSHDADSSFNSLKVEYRRENIYTMQDLFQRLNVSDSVTVVPTTPEDFLDYDALFDDVYRDLAGMVKQNHIFSCGGDGDDMLPTIQLRESNLDEHPIINHKATKKTRKFSNVGECRAHSILLLLVIKCLGLNPYKVVEMWKNYRPMLPVEFQDDELYAEPDASIKAKVKDEKMFRAESRKVLKAKKYGDAKEAAEDAAFGAV